MASDGDNRVDFEDQTKLKPFDVIINDLICELDGDDFIFDEIRNLSRTQLGHPTHVKTGAEYFEILRNNFGEDDMLDFLINVTDYQNWHRDCGSEKVANTLKNYRDRLEQHKREWMKKDIFDPYFVGREKEIKDIICNLTKHKDFKVSGVSVWGPGGIGKTTLANEICRQLWADSSHWQVIKIDLREKHLMGDLFKDFILELQLKDDDIDPSEDLRNSLRDTMDTKLEATILDQLGRINCRTIVMLDNVDDIFNKHAEEFLQFVKNLLEKLQTNCKVKVIITSRVTLQSSTTESPLTGLMTSLKVERLEEKHAKELIKKCTPEGLVSEGESDSLVVLTERIPLALRTICSILKNGCGRIKPAEVIAQLKNDDEKLDLVGMKKCLKESFNRLDDDVQNILMQLTLFKTSSFDLQAANAVLTEGNLRDRQSNILMTKMNLFHLKSRHLIEIRDLTIQTESDRVQNKKRRPELYSLHPLVFKFLSQHMHKNKSRFSDVMSFARIRFFEYMEGIMTIIAKEQENSFYDAESYLREYDIHIQSYFEVVSELRRDPKLKIRIPSFDTSNRIMELGRRTLSQNGQLAWLRWAVELAEHNDEIAMQLMFLGYYIQLLTEMDNIADIPDIIDTTDKMLDNKTLDRRDANMKKAIGNYHYRKAIYYKKAKMEQNVLKNLEKAKEYLEHCKRNETIYIMILANVYNDFGCYYYERDTEKCRMYHEKAIEKAQTVCRHNGVGEDHPDIDLFRNNRAVCILKDVREKTLDSSSQQQHIKEALSDFGSTIAAGRKRGVDKTESHASALKNRSSLNLLSKRYEEARSDAEKCIEVRRKILKEPHVDLTLSYSHLARILYNWGDEMMREGKIDQGMKLLKESANRYDETFEMIKRGGISTSHEEYAVIKEFHCKAVIRTARNKKEELKQKYQNFECDSSDDDSTSLSSEKEISSDEAISADSTPSKSSGEESSGSSDGEQTETLMDVPIDAQKTVDNTSNFTAPITASVSKAKTRYDHQDSGYGSSVSSIQSSTSRDRRLSRQESFEILERPRMVSNSSGSSVFSDSCSSQDHSDKEFKKSEDAERLTIFSRSSGKGSSKRRQRDVSLEELMADICSEKKKRPSKKVMRQSYSQQEAEIKGEHQERRLVRGYSDSATLRTTEQADLMASHVPTNEDTPGDTSVDSCLSVKLTGKRKHQEETENPPTPAKVIKEIRDQEGTEKNL